MRTVTQMLTHIQKMAHALDTSTVSMTPEGPKVILFGPWPRQRSGEKISWRAQVYARVPGVIDDGARIEGLGATVEDAVRELEDRVSGLSEQARDAAMKRADRYSSARDDDGSEVPW